MKTGRVAATVVATVHHPSLAGRRMLLVDLDDIDGTSSGRYTIAVDLVDAGVGQAVLVLDEGSSARLMLGDDAAPVRAVVAGIVDQVTRAPSG